MTTLPANAQQEGARVLDFLERHSQKMLAEHGFEAQGKPNEAAVAGSGQRLAAAVVKKPLTAVCQEMTARGLTPPQIAAARQRAAKAV